MTKLKVVYDSIICSIIAIKFVFCSSFCATESWRRIVAEVITGIAITLFILSGIVYALWKADRGIR